VLKRLAFRKKALPMIDALICTLCAARMARGQVRSEGAKRYGGTAVRPISWQSQLSGDFP